MALLLIISFQILSSEEGDSEVVFRALVAFGTLVSSRTSAARENSDTGHQQKSKSAGSLSVETVGLAKDVASSWAQRLSSETRIVDLQRELQQ